jgi:hypothetical protein
VQLLLLLLLHRTEVEAAAVMGCSRGRAQACLTRFDHG